jgi:hypothetical protein
MFIYILDDDSLLKIFYLLRPALLDENEVESTRILQGGQWHRERWWYDLVHVCRAWRYLVFASASYLGLSLVCSPGTPVAQMLAHSPPLPLTIDYLYKNHNDLTAEDEEGIMIAIQRRDHVRRIRLRMSASSLQKLITATDGEFPILEHLYISSSTKHNTSLRLILPQSFQAPHLRHLILGNFASGFQIGSPLLTAAGALVTLAVARIHPSTYFSPNELLQQLSVMPQLETLKVTFHSPLPNRDVKRQLLRTPLLTHVTLPNLRWFAFKGANAYLEALLLRMTTPFLEKLQIYFFNQLTYSIPNLAQFMNATENPRYHKVILAFHTHKVFVAIYPRDGVTTTPFYAHSHCRHLDWQVSSMVQILNAPIPVLSVAEHLTLRFKEHSMSSNSEGHNEVDRTKWHELLSPFTNVKNLEVAHELVGDISGLLESDNGEPPMGLLPELKELRYPAKHGTRNAFSAFINARQNVGRPVALIRR